MVCSRASMPSTYGGSTQPPRTSSSPAWRMASCLSFAWAASWIVASDTMLMALPCLHYLIAGLQRLHQLVENGVVQKLREGDHHRARGLLAREIGQPFMHNHDFGAGRHRANRLMYHAESEAG